MELISAGICKTVMWTNLSVFMWTHCEVIQKCKKCWETVPRGLTGTSRRENLIRVSRSQSLIPAKYPSGSLINDVINALSIIKHVSTNNTAASFKKKGLQCFPWNKFLVNYLINWVIWLKKQYAMVLFLRLHLELCLRAMILPVWLEDLVGLKKWCNMKKCK